MVFAVAAKVSICALFTPGLSLNRTACELVLGVLCLGFLVVYRRDRQASLGVDLMSETFKSVGVGKGWIRMWRGA